MARVSNMVEMFKQQRQLCHRPGIYSQDPRSTKLVVRGAMGPGDKPQDDVGVIRDAPEYYPRSIFGVRPR